MSDELTVVPAFCEPGWTIYRNEHHFVAQVADADDARLFAASEKLLAALEKCQWNGRNCMDLHTCPVCYRTEDEGHKPDCIVGVAIQAARHG